MMAPVPTRLLRLKRCRDGYYRCSWTGEDGRPRKRSFGRVRALAEVEFAEFYQRWRTDPETRTPGPDGPLTITRAWDLFAVWADARYRRADGTSTGEAVNLADAFRVVLEMYGSEPASEFGPLKLQAVQDRMVLDDLAVNTINARVRKIRAVFRWLASQERVPVTVPTALATIWPVAPERGIKREGVVVMPRATEPVRPVPDAHVWAVCAKLPPTVAAMVKLQYWTAARPGEVCRLRAVDIDTRGEVWIWEPTEHKTAHRRTRRVILIGPHGQDAIRPLMGRTPTAPLFSPREAMRERHAARRDAYTPPAGRYDYRTTPSYKARLAQSTGQARHREAYTPISYAQAITTACEAAGVAHWSPNQLRHNAATRMRAACGRETAQVVLGHSRPETTDIYAEPPVMAAMKDVLRYG